MNGIKVTFSSDDEFITELRAQAGSYAVGDVLRLTRRHTRAGGGAPFTHLTVVSTFLAAGQLIELAAYCGEIWGLGGEPDTKTKQAAQAVAAKIEAAAAELELEVRPGVYEWAVQK